MQWQRWLIEGRSDRGLTKTRERASRPRCNPRSRCRIRLPGTPDMGGARCIYVARMMIGTQSAGKMRTHVVPLHPYVEAQ